MPFNKQSYNIGNYARRDYMLSTNMTKCEIVSLICGTKAALNTDWIVHKAIGNAQNSWRQEKNLNIYQYNIFIYDIYNSYNRKNERMCNVTHVRF